MYDWPPPLAAHLHRWPTACSACHTRHEAGQPEWTAALDALITQRLDHCSLCGVPLTGRQGWSDIVDLPTGRSLATTVCLACRGADPDLVQLRGKLEKRYGTEPRGVSGES